MFNKIYHDSLLQKHYDKIGLFEDNTNGWAYHNWNHVVNVTLTLETILQQLDVPKDYINSAKIASILHDTGAIKGKEGHALRSRVFAEKYFTENNLNPDYQNEILNVIEEHSNGFDSDELMTLALIISDKLDITNERLAKEGYKVPGMRQLQFINSIKVSFQDEFFIVNFITDEKFDLLELQDFYFMKKVLKSIEAFSQKIDHNYVIKLNGQQGEFRS